MKPIQVDTYLLDGFSKWIFSKTEPRMKRFQFTFSFYFFARGLTDLLHFRADLRYRSTPVSATANRFSNIAPNRFFISTLKAENYPLDINVGIFVRTISYQSFIKIYIHHFETVSFKMLRLLLQQTSIRIIIVYFCR